MNDMVCSHGVSVDLPCADCDDKMQAYRDMMGGSRPTLETPVTDGRCIHGVDERDYCDQCANLHKWTLGAPSETKPSNPKDAVGIKKVPFSTISAPVLAELGVGMLEGALKYGRHNYRSIGVRASVYYDATHRHMAAWWEGEDVDPDSGLSHVTKAIASLVVLRDAMIQNKFVDDRPPRSPAGWLDNLNKHVATIVAKYPNPVAPYTQIDMSWATDK